jgi:mono/diheme cytochrome c family protein
VVKQVQLVLVGAVSVFIIPALLACASPNAQDQMALGRHLVIIGGCNDCHTPGYAPMEGNVPEETWLTGDSLGFRGPWGTTYPPNLRLYMEDLTEDQWVTEAQSLQTRPPMPWFNVNEFTEEELRAIYQYISSLEPKGEPAPEYLPPDQEPPPPYIQWPSAP